MGLGMEEEKGQALRDVQINCSMIPKTPAKPDLTSTTHQLYSDSKEKDMFYANLPKTERFKQVVDQANSSETGQVSINLPQESGRHLIPNRYNLTNVANISWDFNTCQVGNTNNSHVLGDGVRINNGKFARDDELNNVSFRDLLAMANAFGTPPTAEDEVKRMAFGASSSIFARNNHPQVDYPSTIISKSTYLPNQNNLGEEVDSEWGSNQIIFKRVSSVLSSSFCQLHSPSRSTADSALDMNERAQFEPITPEKGNANQKLNSAVSESSKYEMCTKRDEQGSKIVCDEVMKIHEKDTTASIQILENHELGKEDSEDADISQPPQKKPRKKRHRPKVVVEGQLKKTPTPRAKKPISSAEGARVKRKYVRKKGIKDFSSTLSEVGTTETDANINTSEGKIEVDANKGTPCSMVTPTGKRKYDRKKGIDQPETAGLDEEIIDTTTRKTARYTRSSCRRSLNFDLENHKENFSAQENLGVNMQCRQEMEEMIEKNDVGIVCEVIHSTNQILNNDLLKPEKHPSRNSQMDPSQTNHLCTDQTAATRGKCLIVFSDVTHDKEAKTLEPKVNPDCWLTPKSPNDPNCCSTTHLTPENGAQGYKREHLDSAIRDEVCITNVNGMFYNSLQAYNSIFTQNSDVNDDICSMRFPEIYKKMKTGRRHDTTSNSQSTMIVFADHMKLEKQPLTDTCSNFLFTSEDKQEYSSMAQWIASNPIKDIPATYSHLNEPKNIGLSALGPTATSRDEVPHQPHTCSESYEIDVLSRKRMNQSKRNVHVDQVIYNHQGYHGSVAKSTGPRLAGKRSSMLTVDFITELLNRLDLNASVVDQSSITACHMEYQHALVPYQRAGAVIPFDQSFDKVKRRRPRPKVELDDETTRVWNLLLENINSEGIDGTDEEKSKWWREERRVFNGRADSFIARMHLVQGDRRFSPWKGSVLDSVVGVFLTQNVSDHLSSSAFMSLAAQFPIKSKKIPTELHEGRTDAKIKGAETCMINHNETCRLDNLLKPVCAEILEDFRCNDISIISSMKSSENSFGGISHEDSLRGQVASVSTHSSVVCHTLLSGKKMIHLMKDKNDAEDAISSQTSEISSQSFVNSPIAQNTECTQSYILNSSEEEHRAGIIPHSFTKPTFVELLHMAETVKNSDFEDRNIFDVDELVQSDSLSIQLQNEVPFNDCTPPTDSDTTSIKCTSQLAPYLGSQSSKCYHLSQKMRNTSDIYCRQGFSPAESRVSVSSDYEFLTACNKSTGVNFMEEPKLSSPSVDDQRAEQILLQENSCEIKAPNNSIYPQNSINFTGCSSSNTINSEKFEQNAVNLHINARETKEKGGRIGKEKQNPIDWDRLRKEAQAWGRKGERTANTLDSVDWHAVRCADVDEVAHTIRERGMNHKLAARIKDFLDRLVRDHGSLDLEWLRDVPPDKAKEYLLSVRGLGLKSVECVRLLTLHHLAFPVDTNVGRIAVRLGWVPLQPLPESLQLHLLELYPMLETIQKYLWPRLCKLDQRTLYELHYQMITFGKVFCTKNKPNCNACPMRGECRHFASAFASARLALPAPEEKSIVTTTENKECYENPMKNMAFLQLLAPQGNQMDAKSGCRDSEPIIEEPVTPEPTIEELDTPEPTIEELDTPEPSNVQIAEYDIESPCYEDPDEIPTIQLNMEEFTQNVQRIMQQNSEIKDVDTSKALVALTPEAALIPVPKLKNVSQLRTEHRVYELPDSHPLLEGMDRREPDDPCPYLLAIWTPGETMNSIEPPGKRCSYQESEKLCSDETCSSCNSIREANSLTVRGTLLIPCRTAMRGSFPLNGTYFQVNEVFSDHESSLQPIAIPRAMLWNLPRRTVFFGTSIPSIFKGLSTEGIQYCFWRGFVCVRGFDRKTRAPRPLVARLHFPASYLSKSKGKTGEN